MKNNKYKNVRVVTFNEDYKNKDGVVLHSKGDKIHIHKSTAEKLKKNGKVKVEEYDYEAEIAKAKKAQKADKK